MVSLYPTCSVRYIFIPIDNVVAKRKGIIPVWLLNCSLAPGSVEQPAIPQWGPIAVVPPEQHRRRWGDPRQAVPRPSAGQPVRRFPRCGTVHL